MHMKKYWIIAVIHIALTNGLSAQIVMPPAYNSSVKINFIRSWDAKAPISNVDTILTRTNKDVMQSTQYFDGLGRPVQTVLKRGALVTGDTAKDMVAPVTYDESGRNHTNFFLLLPNTTGGNSSVSDGLIKLNPFQQDSAFNKGIYSDETYYYSKTVFESSLNGNRENYAPGNNW
ncbi:MAG: hypothetical protein IPP73_11605 [Chitinophagaceae bacterium]|nr:hypothetical protein [Chitinophagaceae bacterium]